MSIVVGDAAYTAFMAEFQLLPSASSLSSLPPGFPRPAGRILTSNPLVSRPAPLEPRKEVRRSRQRVLFCRCGSSSIWARGLCQRCYSRVRADERHFAGLRDRVLARDRHTCQGCQATSISTVLAVHHRQPGVSSLELLVTLCPACHALVERTQVLFRDVPELLRLLWRELHPAASEQLPLFL
ncbi:HNH endonuclease [Acidisarcina polymorpha]|uniref:HNH endonuclease n=1 Tax=Acidisarcina polymorpha TaxID=2211140 RepID=UPI001237A7CF|nr:HNH endonuclease [Acidisarcina polymorpha]